MTRRTRWLVAGSIVFVMALLVHLVATEWPATFALVLMLAGLLSILYPCTVLARISWRLVRRRPVRPLVTWTELAVWLVSLALTVAITVPLYMNIGSRARIAKAQADVRSLSSAVALYTAHTGRLPEHLDDLTGSVANASGQRQGPFVQQIPSPPAGWSPYLYERQPGGTFSIRSQGGSDGEARYP